MSLKIRRLKSWTMVALKISGVYALVSALWIFLSDKLIFALFSNSAVFSLLGMIKGWLFVIFTAALLFVLVRRDLIRHSAIQRDLAASRQIYQSLIECSPVALYGLDLNGQVMSWNPSAEKIFGWKADDVIGQLLPSIPADKWVEFSDLLKRVKKGHRVFGLETVRLNNNGTFFTARLSAAPLYGDQDDIVGIMVASEDVTEKKRTESELRKLSLAVEQSPVVVVITDLNGDIEYVNPKFSEVSGYTWKEAIGKNPRFLQSGQTSIGVYNNLWQTILSGKEWQGELLNRHKDGRLYWERALIAPLRNTQGEITHYIAVNEDVTRQKTYERQLEHQATHDALTGLANRALLKDRLEQAVNFAQRSKRIVAVLLLDLDRFKLVNDSLGHGLGDELICQVAQRLTGVVRASDTVARFGGDEFVVLLTEVVSEDDIMPTADKILQALSAPYFIDNRDITLTASGGISHYPKHGEDISTLLRKADIAMYQSKERGNCSTFYSSGMGMQIREAWELEGALRQALKRDQFRLYYQPKVDLKTGLIHGCEALLRWEHPERGMIPPGQFIPIAEDTGLILSIGEWALKEACQKSLIWQKAGLPPISVAVNLSARQFRQGDLVALVRNTLAETGLTPELLELELTESMIMDNPHDTAKILSQLKDLGVSLSLDDFGTGYSSLNYLRRFPVDTLKIDQSFVRDVSNDPSGASVITSIIDIAHNLNLTAIAEGVETQDQLDFLRAKNCDSVQGFFFSKPLPEDEFVKFVQQGPLLRI